METLMFATNIMEAVCYGVLCFFVAYAVIMTHHLIKKVDCIGEMTRKLHALITCLKLQQDVNQIAEMERDLNKLVEAEHYTDANKLHEIIELHKQRVNDALVKFKETYGDMEISMEVFQTKGE